MPAKKIRKEPRVGSTFHRAFKGRTYRLTIVNRPGGVGYKVGKNVFSSPSGAAKSIGGSEVNGWVFWKIDEG